MLTIRTVEIREVFMISMLIVLKLQLVDQGQMDGDFDSLLCVSGALSSFDLQWIVQATILLLPKSDGASSFCSEELKSLHLNKQPSQPQDLPCKRY
jgi:hypothetical protein